MGGAIYKDKGATNYEERNIYLNNKRTFGRMKPTRPITLHQKALFCFWISGAVLWIILRVKRFIHERRNKEEVGAEEIMPESSTKPALLSRFGRGDQTVENETTRHIFSRLTESDPSQPSFEEFLFKLNVFGVLMLYFWLCDYQHIWPRTHKQYSRDIFVFIFALLVITAFVFTIRKTPEKLLNRDQTEEWKGWMQVQFVWYHYFDAHEVFNSIRCYIGAYVWMTGFGNFSYFWIRKDYSLFRLLKMMFRLNFLVVMVMAVTNHEFVRYYVCAMHTYWFLSVYAMMAVLKSKNTSRYFMAAKFAVYLIINTIIFDVPGLSYYVFWPFQFVLNVGGKLDYWIYRSTLDHYATFVGMLCAYNYPYVDEFMKYLEAEHEATCRKRKVFLIRLAITLGLLVVFVLWFYFVLFQPRPLYKTIHPYTSCIPILVYIWFRNVNPLLRSRFLDLFAFLGKVTLETYLSQIHIYMIGDAKEILIYLPGYPMLNFLLASAIYLAVSYKLFHLTLFFNSYIFPKNMTIICKNVLVGTLWLGFCYAISFCLNVAKVW